MNAAAWSVLLAVLVTGWVLLDGAVQGAGATLLQERGHDGGNRRREPAERRRAESRGDSGPGPAETASPGLLTVVMLRASPQRLASW